MNTLYSLTICMINGLTAEKYEGVVTDQIAGIARSWDDIADYVRNFNDDHDIEIFCEERHLKMLIEAGYGINGFECEE